MLVTPYNHDWPGVFKEESNRVKQALGLNCVIALHIGSTAVPGLAAKPVIDIIAVVKNILTVDSRNERMAELGFAPYGEKGVPFRRFFKKETPTAVNVHVYEKRNPEIDRHLRFRDYLRDHSEDSKAYGELKEQLAKNHPDDIDAYTQGKSEFVRGIDSKAGFDGMCMVQVYTLEEIAAYQEITGQSPEQLADNFYFVLRHGVEIVGASRVEFIEDAQAIIHPISIKPNHVTEHLEDEMTYLLERWVEEQGIAVVD